MVQIADLMAIEGSLQEPFAALDEICLLNQEKVLKALQSVRLASTDFNWATGYGYGDVGREKVEAVYAALFRTEDALVRPNMVSGTHAIALTIKALTKAETPLPPCPALPTTPCTKCWAPPGMRRGT